MFRYYKAFAATVVTAASVLFFAATASPALAQATPQFFFAQPGQTPTSFTQGLTSLGVPAGQDFTLSVYYQYDPTFGQTYDTIQVFIGFDQSNSYGISATPQNNRLTLGSGLDADTAVTNIGSGLQGVPPNQIGGGRDPLGQPSSAVRPYGIDVILESSSGDPDFFFSGTSGMPVKLFDLTLRNANLGSNTQDVVIYTSGDPSNAEDFTTALRRGENAILPASSTTLNVFQSISAVPEPSSLALLLPAVLLMRPLLRKRLRGGNSL